MKKLLLYTLFALFGATTMYAYDFEADGIYYNITSVTTVSVTYYREYRETYSGNVSIPEYVTYKGTQYCVTSIGDLAFANCSSLTAIKLPNSVTSIGDNAFYKCRSLTAIELPNSVTSIGDSAFFKCSSLKKIHSKAVVPPRAGSDFCLDTPSDLVVYVPCGSVEAYKSADNWNDLHIVDSVFYKLSVETSDIGRGKAIIISSVTCETNEAVIVAIPNDGYVFDRWDDGSTQNPRRITVNSDFSLTAYFKTRTSGMYIVAVSPNNAAMGYVTGGGEYYYDADAVIEAIPCSGYTFDRWSDGLTKNPRTLRVRQDIELSAIFTPVTGTSDAAAPEILVTSSGRTVTVYGADRQPLALYNMQGVCLFRTPSASDPIAIPVPLPGIYFLKTPTATLKVIVR